MAAVFEFNRKRCFSLEEARELLPLVKRITDDAVLQVERLKNHIEEIDPAPSQHSYYEQELETIVEKWTQKITKLGCEPKGPWLVNFDNGEGYYCWSHPEDDVEFFHSYNMETGAPR